MSLGAAPIAGLAALALGCSAPAVAEDGGHVAADAPRATPPCLPLDFPPRLEHAVECGLCIAPHERVLGWTFAFRGLDYVHARAVPEGLLVVVPTMGTYVALVRHDGQVEVLDEHPFMDPGDYPALDTDILSVPGQSRFWVVNNRVLPRLGVSLSPPTHDEVVLYSHDEAGFRREAAGETRYHLLPTLALAGGELVAHLVDQTVRTDGTVLHLGRIRARSDGTIHLLEVEGDDFPIEGTWQDSRGLWWPHREEGFFLAVPFGAVFEQAGQTYEHWDAWLVRLTGDLEIASDPIRLGVEPFDPRYTGGPDERHSTPILTSVVRHPSGWASLVSHGSVPQLGAQEWSQFWVQWVSPEGEPAFPSPGVLVNETRFPGSDLVMSSPYYPRWAVYPVALPGDRVGVGWADFNADPTLTMIPFFAQVAAPDGALGFPEPIELEDTRVLGPGAQDGPGTAFRLAPRYVADGTPTGRLDRIGVEAYGGALERLWPEPRDLHHCPHERLRGGDLAGDSGEGVWVAWQEELREPGGALVWVLKVAWIRRDGSFAWAAE